MCMRIRAEILYTTTLDENSDLGKRYLDKENMTRSDQIKGRRKMSNIRTKLYKRKIIR